jgi:hypothetical protein
MVAGLISRILLVPSGMLVQTLLVDCLCPRVLAPAEVRIHSSVEIAEPKA